jgi:hypothetical protein
LLRAFYDGKQACHWPTAAVAHEIGAFIDELHAAKDLSELVQVHPGLWPFPNFLPR